MTNLDPFLKSLKDHPDDSSKLDATLRLLCVTARRYDGIYGELERLKESTGFDKPFPFLRLPGEVRNEIYTYALYIDTRVDATPRSLRYLSTNENPRKPPTAGLLRVNKQIYHEAVGILYSKNRFKFGNLGDLLTFEKRVGFENCMRVRAVIVRVRFPVSDDQIPDWKDLPQSSPFSIATYWVAALKACRFEKTICLQIQARDSLSPLLSRFFIHRDLQERIEEFVAKTATNPSPFYFSTRFHSEKTGKFPRKWHVRMRYWGDEF